MASSNHKVVLASDKLPARDSGRWAQDKLSVLSYFIDQFTVGMKPTDRKRFNWEQLVYIDLFAGPGKCVDRKSGAEFDGSPLRALSAKHPFSKLFFVENFDRNYDALSRRIEGHPFQDRCEIIREDCHAAIRRIVAQRTSRTLYLAFIDPEGLDIQFDAIKELTESVPCDLIINWFFSAINRNIAQWFHKGESRKFDAFMGTSVWQSGLDQNKSKKQILQGWVDLYRAQLTTIGYEHQGDPLVLTNTRNSELYWLWFASKHKTGLKFWNQARTGGLGQGELF